MLVPVTLLLLGCVDESPVGPAVQIETSTRVSATCESLTCNFAVMGPTNGQANFRWDFGDGAQAEGPEVKHLYASRESVTVVLTITGDAGPIATETVEVDPANGAPTTWIFRGESIQAAVDAHPAGTEFLIKSGVHRLQDIRPKHGNTFVGEDNTVLSGAVLVQSVSRAGGLWVIENQVQEGQRVGSCDTRLQDAGGTRYTGCRYPEDLFLDDVALFQVLTLGEVAPGKWFFDYAQDRVYFADDPTDRKVELSAARHAFRNSADNVTIRNLIVEKYANPAQHGAIQASGNGVTAQTRGWVVDDVEVRLNHGVGIRVGHETHVTRSKIHHNGQLGVGGVGNYIVIEDNEIAYNNTLGFAAGWEAGGTKFAQTEHLVVRRNHVHHNAGPGLWTDGNNIHTLYEGNVVTDNSRQGIFHEISYDAIIRDNEVRNNGFDPSAGWLYGAGILVAHSSNVEVYGNVVANNANGIVGIQQPRGAGLYGPYLLANLWVHNNEITMDVGLTGLGQDVGDNAIFTARNNRFDFNSYVLGTGAKYFAFMNAPRTQSEWVDQYGQDPNGTFGSIP